MMLTSKPPFRKLRGYAFDPVSSLDLDTADINQITYNIPWEENLTPGPSGEYVRVVDRDPVSDAVYMPVDLNQPHLLAADGLTPSETNPQFHQQMVYAVSMSTIKNFEKALGRKVMWSPKEVWENGRVHYEYVGQLFIYPHAIRDQNAYYSPDRKALLFGYYNAQPVNASIYMPGGIVYTCLSHDIIAHETTHAILDGMYTRFMDSTNPDLGAFHEGFADIVALLQHFTYPEIVCNQISKVRGELDAENMLTKLALEFGQSSGGYGALREAFGIYRNGEWQKKGPNTTDYKTIFECHDRGGLLVAAVFDAFLAIYKSRTADLLRIYTGGSGILGTGAIHPDLANRLADEASTTASHLLNMCIRALDYCPPVDLNYGDYLRALITADKELVPNDDKHYRIAFINAFRKRGIFPQGIPNLSSDTLCYSELDDDENKRFFDTEVFDFLRKFKEELSYETDRETIFRKTRASIAGDASKNIAGIHAYITAVAADETKAPYFEQLTGLVFSSQFANLGVRVSRSAGQGPSIEVHSLRLNSRVGPDGAQMNQIVITLAQRCGVAVTTNEKDDTLEYTTFSPDNSRENMQGNFVFRGGCTLIIDLDTLRLKHVIKKPMIEVSAPGEGQAQGALKLNDKRVRMQYQCTYGKLAEEIGLAAANAHKNTEPFAFIHKHKTSIHEW